MRVGVYVDGYNLYYGAKSCCGRGPAGWKWIDVRGLVQSVIASQGSWAQASVSRIVYCTARVDSVTNPSGYADQDVYLKALVATSSVDWIEYGNYVARTKTAFLATDDPQTGRPVILRSGWPVMVQDSQRQPVRDARFMVKYLHLEEKGSDVNVASHFLVDVLDQQVDAIVVVSNDSDLAYPIRTVRDRVPVAVINPRSGQTAGALKGAKTDGVGRHWWWKLNDRTYRAHQLPASAGGQTKPSGW